MQTGNILPLKVLVFTFQSWNTLQQIIMEMMTSTDRKHFPLMYSFSHLPWATFQLQCLSNISVILMTCTDREHFTTEDIGFHISVLSKILIIIVWWLIQFEQLMRKCFFTHQGCNHGFLHMMCKCLIFTHCGCDYGFLHMMCKCLIFTHCGCDYGFLHIMRKCLIFHCPF